MVQGAMAARLGGTVQFCSTYACSASAAGARQDADRDRPRPGRGPARAAREALCQGRALGASRPQRGDPDDPDVADVIADWKDTPGAVAIRIFMRKEEQRSPDDPGFDRILRAAVKHDFPVNILCWDNVEAGTAVIDRHPDTRFVVDHLAILQPRTPPAPPEPWADLPKVLELAKRENAVIKVSGACTLSREPYPFDDIWDPLARVFDAWGFDRCLWGTDWTRAHAVVNYEQAVRPFLETDRITADERAMLMGGSCAKVYGWSPKSG